MKRTLVFLGIVSFTLNACIAPSKQYIGKHADLDHPVWCKKIHKQPLICQQETEWFLFNYEITKVGKLRYRFVAKATYVGPQATRLGEKAIFTLFLVRGDIVTQLIST